MFGVQKKVIYLVILLQYNVSHTYMFMVNCYNARMDQNAELPNDLNACHALLRQQLDVNAKLAEVNATQARQLEELTTEQEKLRKLIVRLTQGNVSEKRSLSDTAQGRLPFEDEAEWQAAKAEAEAEAEEIQDKITSKRGTKKTKRRDESLPRHLRREERIADVPEELKQCPTHGERTVIGYDETETLVRKPAELYVVVTKYPKFACSQDKACGIASPERPTSLVEGNKYDTSVAATIIEAKWFHYIPIYRCQDLFSGSGWTPSRSTLLNIVTQSAFVLAPLILFMKRLVQNDTAVGIDDTSCRMLLPREIPEFQPGDLKGQRLAEKVAEARRKGHNSLLAKMWVYSGLNQARYNIFDFRVSRHREGPEEFFASSRCKVQGDCYSGNTGIVLRSNERLEFVACWGHARRKVVESQTYKAEGEVLLKMIQVLYDIECRGAELDSASRQQLRDRESRLVLSGIRKWLDSFPAGYFLPKSDFAEAVRYIDNHWQALLAYVGDGSVPIDNNRVEQLMKQVALGRKAWLFVGNVEAGEQSAMLMSLVSSARRHDLDVWTYIKDVLDQLLGGSTDYASLLPDAWAKAHPENLRQYRIEERRDKADAKQLRAARRRQLAAKART